jgi:hypothetical protein
MRNAIFWFLQCLPPKKMDGQNGNETRNAEVKQQLFFQQDGEDEAFRTYLSIRSLL